MGGGGSGLRRTWNVEPVISRQSEMEAQADEPPTLRSIYWTAGATSAVGCSRTALSSSQPTHAISTPITPGSSTRPTERPIRAKPPRCVPLAALSSSS